MRVRRVLLNCALGLAVIAVGAVAVTSIGSARTTRPVGEAVPVTRGTLISTVTANGNVEAVHTTQVNLAGSGGTVTKIYVDEGTKVTKGQRLLKVDNASEKRDLRTARASLTSAQAKVTTTTQGRSAAEISQDNASIASAAQSVRNAETALKGARATYALDQKQQDAIVKAAGQDVDEARDQLHDAHTANDSAATPDPSLASAVTSAESAFNSAKSALSSAKRTRSATLLRDRQSIDTNKGQVASATKQLDQQRAAAAVNAQPARPGAVEDAQAQVDSAQVSVDQAERALADTVLTAPVDGTVAKINAVRGQSSSSASAGGSTGSTGASSGGGSAASAAGSSSSSTSSSTSSSSSSGLVVLTSLGQKEISATVAEVDVTKLKTGLEAQIVFPASGVTATGTLTGIDTEQTVTNNVVEYGVTIRMDSRESAVKIGQTASLTITARKKENALIVPTSALRTVNGETTVTRRVNDVDGRVTVKTGLVGTTGTEITSGLSVGDQVVLPTTGGS